MGLFFYTKKGSIISTVDLPTTEIIEPENFPWVLFLLNFLMWEWFSIRHILANMLK